MISANRLSDTEPIIDIGSFKREFPGYYSCLDSNELQPNKIVLCSNLIVQKDELTEKIILIYNDRLVILKSVNNKMSKNILYFEDINFIIREGVPDSDCISIDYKCDLKERIFYDKGLQEMVDSLLFDLRRKILDNTYIADREDYSELEFSDMEENSYIGAVLARKSLFDKTSVICSLKQRRIYDRLGLVFRKTVSPTHFSFVCKKEIIIFMEKVSMRKRRALSGDLLHIPIQAIKNVSLEATGKGMILKIQFNTGRRLELFYENERTDQLLKIMSYINSIK